MPDTGTLGVVPATGGSHETPAAETKPCALHKTQSIFLRNLAPTITHQEVEGVIVGHFCWFAKTISLHNFT